MGRRVVGGAAGGTPPRCVLSWSENPATGRLHQGAIVEREDADLSRRSCLCLCLALLLLPLPPSLSLPVPPLPPAQKVFPLRGAVKHRKAGCGKLPKFDFFFFSEERCQLSSIDRLFAFIFLFTPVFSAISLSLGSSPPLFASQAVWHPAPSL